MIGRIAFTREFATATAGAQFRRVMCHAGAACTMERRLHLGEALNRCAALVGCASLPQLAGYAVTEKMLTKAEALELVLKALEHHDALRPVPSVVSIAQVAEMLDCCEKTVRRMKFPRIGDKIPYSAVLEKLAER
jgi:hypothetical protein